MYFKRLEITLVINLTLLLLTAMFLTNGVFLILSQKQEQKRIIETVELEVAYWEQELKPTVEGGDPILLSDLEKLCRHIGPSCDNVVYKGGEGDVQRRSEKDIWGLERILLTSAKSGNKVVRITNLSGFFQFFSERVLLLALPVFDRLSTKGYIGVALNYTPLSKEVKRSQKLLFLYSLFNLIVLVVIGFFRFSKYFIRPIDRLVEKFTKYDMSEGFQLLLDNDAGGEFGRLSKSISNVLSSVERDRKRLEQTIGSLEEANRVIISTQEKMIKTEKLATVGRLTAGLAHEIGNPIGIIQGYVELLRSGTLAKEERREFSARSIEELDRINYLIQQLMDTTRINKGPGSLFSVHKLINNLVDMISVSADCKGCKIEKTFISINDEIWGNKDALHQVFLNCLLNAIDAINEKGDKKNGQVAIVTENFDDIDLGAMLRISFIDNGIGIKEENRETIFEPFFTTKKAGEGTGLGLAVSQIIIEAFQGQFIVSGEYGSGTTIQIELQMNLKKE